MVLYKKGEIKMSPTRRSNLRWNINRAHAPEGEVRVAREIHARRKWVMGTVLTIALVVGIGCAGFTVGAGETPRNDSDRANPVSSGAMVARLRGLLPAGKVRQMRGVGVSDSLESPKPSAELIFDNGRSAAEIHVNVSRLPISIAKQMSFCPLRANFPYNKCTRRVLPNGSTLLVNAGYKVRTDPKSAKSWYSVLTTKDGGQVVVSQSGVPSVEAESTLPLALDRLAAIASSDVWNSVVSALPKPTSSPATPSESMLPKSQIFAILKNSLPEGLQVADMEGAEKGYVICTVDDGQGKSLIAVNVQQWMPGQVGMQQIFKDAARNPDGTLVVVRKGPSASGGRGAYSWDVDTWRPSGLRVLVTELNSSAYGMDATRTSFPLSVEQLRAIALSPRWAN